VAFEGATPPAVRATLAALRAENKVLRARRDECSSRLARIARVLANESMPIEKRVVLARRITEEW
jgi:hypothetical protein